MGSGGDDIEDLALGPHGGGGGVDDAKRHDDKDEEADDGDGAVLALPSRPSGSAASRGRRPRRPAAAANDDEEEDLDAAADEGIGIVPGTARVWIKTMGCAHNVADSETMAGVLTAQGYRVAMDGCRREQEGGGAEATSATDSDPKASATVWLLNSCTVKDPSEQAVATVIKEAHSLGKPVVIAGCVPSGQKNSKVLLPPAPAPGGKPLAVGLLGVAQLGRVAEVVEAAVRGESVALLGRGRGERALPDAELPQARRNPHIAIVPLSQGCLGSCTYCKTVHARGALSSYAPEQIEARVLAAARDPRVREVHLSSEDVGAYGRDRGTTLAALLERLTKALDAAADEHGQVEEEVDEDEDEEAETEDDAALQQRPPNNKRKRRLHRVFLRVGMSNPPFLLRDGALEAVSKCLRHPAAFRWLHLPVQSGDDGVLKRMNREYTRADFEEVVAGLKARVPGLVVATDVIVGFPGEDEAAFEATLQLLRQHRFPSAHATKFYPRPGTPAARYRPRVPTQVQKARSAAAAFVIEGRDLAEEGVEGGEGAGGGGRRSSSGGYSPYRDMVGTTQRVVVVDVAADGVSLVAHAKNYAQVLLEPAPGLMGAVVDARIVSASRWSVKGEVLRVLFSPQAEEGEEAAGAASAKTEASSPTSAAAAAAARARVRAAREQRAAKAAAKAAERKDAADSAAPSRDQQSSAAPSLPPTPPKQRPQKQEAQESSSSLETPAAAPPKPAAVATTRWTFSKALALCPTRGADVDGAARAVATTRLAAASSALLLSAGLLLLAVALLTLGATTLRDLGRLA
jgi:threonylcarbamoyladenosine tRNA methylthiotransferase CDKAL1